MPIEIMELVIKASVGDDASNQTGNTPPSSAGSRQGQAAQKALEKAVREMLDIIKHKNER